MIVLAYITIAIGALWGLLTFFALAQEEKEIKELIQSARNVTRHSHGSE
jgi:hypothetical protein